MKRLLFSNLTLRKAVLLSLLLFAFLTLLLFIGAKTRVAHLETVARKSLTKGISTEQNYLVAQGELYAADPDIKTAIKTKDSYTVLSILNQRPTGKVQAVAVADSEGTIFSRTLSTLGRGDNAFVIGPLGRELVRTGTPVFAIERSGLDPSQMIILAARYIEEDGKTLGAVFTTNFMNDTYATRFANAYLPPSVQVLFYSHHYGIYGESVTDPSVRKLLSSYLYPESDWMVQGKTGTVLRFPDGKYYSVLNTEFPGIQHSPGGALLLVPIYNLLIPAQIVIAITVLLFCAYLLFHHQQGRKLRKEVLHYNHMLGACALLLVGGVIFIVDLIPFSTYDVLHTTGHVLYNSVLTLTPPIQVFDQGYEQNIAVTLNTGPESINTVGADLAYDPSVVEVLGLSNVGSFCTHTLEQTVDASAGKIHYSCSIPNPGFSGQGKVVVIRLRALTAGTFSLKFLPETQVLANDGLATNVLRLATDGSYTARESSRTSTLSLFSPTHPNAEEWYSSKNIDFTWGGTSTATYGYSLNQSSTTASIPTSHVTGQKITVTAPSGGVYFFHLAPEQEGRLGKESTYKVKIDTIPPTNIQIRSSDATLLPGDVARLELSAIDNESGLQNNFYLAINNGLFLPTQQSVYAPLSKPGLNTVTVRAYDKAGNHSDKTIQIYVKGTVLQELLEPIIRQ